MERASGYRLLTGALLIGAVLLLAGRRYISQQLAPYRDHPFFAAGGWWARVERALASLDLLHHPATLFQLALYSAIIWGAAVLANVAVLEALGIRLPLVASILVLVVLQVGVSIATVPAAIALFEYLCVLSLARFGVPQPSALSFGLLLHAIVLIPSLVGLAWMFVWRGNGTLGREHTDA